MIVVLGATGHIGRALVAELEAAGEHVRALSGHGKNPVDAHDREALRAAFEGAERLFLLNPPAPPTADVDVEERKTVRAILHAVAETRGLVQVVAESTMGAGPYENAGDLGVLYELEQGLAKLPVPSAVMRGAYYFSNWDMQLEIVKETGKLESFLPADFVMRMVAPADIGRFGASLLRRPVTRDPKGKAGPTELLPIEGPRRYSPRHVADAFGKALGRAVEVVEVPRERWQARFVELGFSPRAAESFTKMTELTVDGLDLPDEPTRGTTTLEAYIERLVAA